MAKRKTARKKTKRSNGGFAINWNTVNSALNKWEKKLHTFTSKQIMTMAMKKKNQIAKEVKFYADGIVDTLNRADFLSNKNHLVKEAKKNLNTFLKKVQKSDVAHKARKLATTKGSEILSMFDFPNKKEVSKLNARLNQLEKQLKSLS